MTLYVRMILYFVFAGISGRFGLQFDSVNGLLIINVEDLAVAVTGIIGFVATFAASRVAKQNGGKT